MIQYIIYLLCISAIYIGIYRYNTINKEYIHKNAIKYREYKQLICDECGNSCYYCKCNNKIE